MELNRDSKKAWFNFDDETVSLMEKASFELEEVEKEKKGKKDKEKEKENGGGQGENNNATSERLDWQVELILCRERC